MKSNWEKAPAPFLLPSLFPRRSTLAMPFVVKRERERLPRRQKEKERATQLSLRESFLSHSLLTPVKGREKKKVFPKSVPLHSPQFLFARSCLPCCNTTTLLVHYQRERASAQFTRVLCTKLRRDCNKKRRRGNKK